MKDTGLRGKVVVDTGAAAGIGLATARRFASEGCRVAAWDVNDAGQEELRRELASLGGEALFRKVSVCSDADVEAAVAEVVGRWGAVDVLVNNAGITRYAQFVKWKDGAVAGTMTDDAFDSVISVNLKGVFLCSRAVVPHMTRKESGVFLTAFWVVALYENFGQKNYAATKGG